MKTGNASFSYLWHHRWEYDSAKMAFTFCWLRSDEDDLTVLWVEANRSSFRWRDEKNLVEQIIFKPSCQLQFTHLLFLQSCIFEVLISTLVSEINVITLKMRLHNLLTFKNELTRGKTLLPYFLYWQSTKARIFITV